VLGAHLDATHHIMIDPEMPQGAYRQMLPAADDTFAAGSSLVAFPQGTLLGIGTGFSAGAFRLADRFSRPLLPVVLSGPHRVWQYPFSPVVSFGCRIDMRVLRPLRPGTA
jgi:1-acyl-sn-glycerol-3-phosphate acyltransferase